MSCSYYSAFSSSSSSSTNSSSRDNHAAKKESRRGRRALAVNNLFAHHNWNQIRTILNTPRKRERLCRHKDKYNTPSLALAMCFLPPLDIIQLMHQINPGSIFETDVYGSNVLQIACLNGASYECIDYILSQTTAAGTDTSVRRGDDILLATKLNHDKASALHHAVEFACLDSAESLISKAHSDSSYEGKQSYLRVIDRVICAAPAMLNVKDKESNTPIDLVQFMKAKTTPASTEYERLDEIYQLLLASSVTYYRRRKRDWEEEGYEINC